MLDFFLFYLQINLIFRLYQQKCKKLNQLSLENAKATIREAGKFEILREKERIRAD